MPHNRSGNAPDNRTMRELARAEARSYRMGLPGHGEAPSLIGLSPAGRAEQIEAELLRLDTLESFADSNREAYAEHVRGWFDADTVRAVLDSGEWGTVEG